MDLGPAREAMTQYSKVLTPVRSEVLKKLGPAVTPREFYLAGGTAIALQLGHRQSIDLDWFTEGRFKEPMHLARHLEEQGITMQVHNVESGTLQGTVSRVQVSFFGFPYPLLQPTIAVNRFKCRSASVADLAAMKLSAIAQRGAKKDFVDIYALGKRTASLPQMLDWYQKKFNITNTAHLLFSLNYFDDADRERMPRMAWNVGWRTIKQTISTWVKDVGR
jgi:hypothetical protein